MKVEESQKEIIFERKNKLLDANKVLKTEFVGLDKIIDEICSVIEPWYVFPESQIRPTIINLWGMTGVGKTSLIKRLFELIGKSEVFYKFDVGDYASDNSTLRYDFSEKLRKKQDDSVAIAFDEFQLGRTIDENGDEVDRTGLRAVWDLLDSGKFDMFQESYYGTQVFQLTVKLEKCIEDGITVRDGVITSKIEVHDAIFGVDDDDDDDDEIRSPKKTSKKKENSNKSNKRFVPKSWYWQIRAVWDDRFLTSNEVGNLLDKLDEKQTISFLKKTMEEAFKPREYDFSKSLIFVIGNIDEAYYMTKSVDPDEDADRFYKHSLEITLPEMKDALRRRYRSEQIARLGNNHIIYPSFSSDAYKKLIALEFGKVNKKVKNSYDLEIKFDSSAHDIVYKEGVFPTQGARPVFTTMASLIEANVSKVIVDILESGEDITSVTWAFKRGKFVVEFNSGDKTIYTRKYPVILKIENLRKSNSDERQAHVAIHEAGHAITAIAAIKLMPTEVVSKTASTAEGFCAVDFPEIWTRDVAEADIICSLGGLLAETMIFGNNNLSNGANSDLERATSMALSMVKEWGMGPEPVVVNHKSINVNDTHYTAGVEKYDEEALRIVKNCKDKAEAILEEHMHLMLRMGDYLSKNSRMNKAKIEKMVSEYSPELVKNIKTKKNYYNFKETIADKLKEEERKLGRKKNLK